MRSPAPANPVIAIATDSDAGERLDRFLARALPDLTRTRVKALIEDGRVAEGGTTIREPSRRVKPGEAFALDLPPAAEPVPQGEAIALDIVYEDDDLLVLDKPAGLVVHPAPGNPAGTLVNALIAHCGAGLSGIGGVRRPGIVHRLDKDTSGLMVVAKTDRAHQGLAGQFKAHSLARAYLAVVWGLPAPPTGTIEGAIGRDPRDRKRMAVVAGERGKPALTRYRVLRRLGPAALVECRLATGRTHQIRVHLAERGHPVVGDPLYGGGLTPARRRAAGP
ncbi:MAG: RluA family pseudouridine synthase, partial [Alphaproteobacteria bacterium]|nr:RluA family pseudouridine synthase [Alphaproteobacteria bacterium]